MRIVILACIAALAMPARVFAQAAAPGALPAAPAAPAAPIDASALKAHVGFLASDALMGRDPERDEFAIATRYVASRFAAAGLQPAGPSGGWLEPVPLVRARTTGRSVFWWKPRRGSARRLVAGADYFPGTNPGMPVARAMAPIVFVGYGLSLPGLGHDDYRGIDVRGKIVAIAPGGPARFSGDERGILWDGRTKRENAAAHGAIGTIDVQIDQARDAVPFATSTMVAARGELAWVRADGASRDGPSAVPLLATLSERGAYAVFGKRWQRNVRQGQSDDPIYVPLMPAGQVRATTHTETRAIDSGNVLGLLPGSDPVLGREIVVVSAHLDHLGVRSGGTGDRINNGALDNAIGVAGVIEIARDLATAPVRPRRSILFVRLTGEEAGLLGSDYLVNDPAMPVGRIVADVNLDMPILTYRFEDLIAYGSPHSTLGRVAADVTARYGLPTSPDPDPQASLFIRSDQFSFVRHGIPALMLWPGRAGPGAQATDDFLAHHYHQPSDDVHQPIDWQQAARFFTIASRIAASAADMPDQPRWLDHDVLCEIATGTC